MSNAFERGFKKATAQLQNTSEITNTSKAFGDASVTFRKGKFESIVWYSSSSQSTIANAEKMIKDLQAAVAFAKAGKFPINEFGD